MLPETERYLDLARQGRNAWWRYLLGAALILFFWLVLGFLPYLALSAFYTLDDVLTYIAVNVSIIMMLAGLALAMRVLHRRPLKSLVTPLPKLDWRRVGQGAAAWAALGLVIVVIEHLLYPDRYYLSFNPERFFTFAVLVLVVTPIQTTTEELVFRGYVMQGLGLILRSPAAIAILSAAVFAIPHLLNPEVRQHGLLLAASYFVIGLLLALITLRDGRLELAIGVHAMNNLLLALAANYEGSVLTTESVFTARELDPVYALVTLIAGSFAFYWWFFRRARRR
ncbi:MAG: CPBP family intramembrane metalloprotease [Betaproteobacteria bacterium]|nr:CPBP family intramembrane metalloprotease [Betaproteobacteria bacterium]